MTIPKWKEFEIAVANFVKALDPNAEVKHDVNLADVHTEKPRQRDVWVEAKVLQHFPVKVYISCKREKRKLDQQDIDAFHGELLSSGAHLGVIYSYSGFGPAAIEKSKKIGRIYCCRLYQNEPPDIPESFIFSNSYCCTPRISLSVLAPIDTKWKITYWRDLFQLTFEDKLRQQSALDAIVEVYLKGEKESTKIVTPKDLFPPNWVRSLELKEEHPPKRSITIIIHGQWNIYQGKIEAHLINGSYCFTTGEFIGSQSTPFVDLNSTNPGLGWSLLDERPSELCPGFINGVFILSGGNVREALINELGPKLITTERIDLRQ